MRKIFFDTETTGLSSDYGDRVIELAFVEMIDKKITNQRHYYLNPEGRKSGRKAFEIHGIKDSFLLDKPTFNQIVDELIDWLKGAELLAHNAKFDVGMINNELRLAGKSERINQICKITDTIDIARKKLPISRFNLDSIINYLKIEVGENRKYHSALTDSILLAKVYQQMHKTQEILFEQSQNKTNQSKNGLAFNQNQSIGEINQEMENKAKAIKVKLSLASPTEQKLHDDFFSSKKSN